MKKVSSKQDLDSSYLDIVKKLLINMKYGSITLIIQDGKIIQIDRIQKYRIKD